MAKFSLIIAICSSAFSLLADPLQRLGYLPELRFLNMYLYIPATLCGTWLLIKKGLFIKYRLLSLVMLYVCLSMLWLDSSEINQGLLVSTYIFLTIPIAALLAEYQYQVKALRLYVFAILFVLAAVVLLSFNFGYSIGDLLAYSMNIVDPVTRAKVTNRNSVAFLFSLGVLAILVTQLLQSAEGEKFHSTTRLVFLFVLLPLIFAVVIATGSRGASIALVVALLYLLIRSKISNLARVIVVFVALGAVIFTIRLAKDVRSESVLTERFVDAGEVYSVGERLRIWQFGFEAFADNPFAAVFGFGSAGASKVLAEYADTDYYSIIMMKAGAGGVPRLSAHNAFLDWLFCYGIVGGVLSLWLLYSILCKARQYDKEDKVVWRMALLILALLGGCTTIIYREHVWVMLGSVILAATIMAERDKVS